MAGPADLARQLLELAAADELAARTLSDAAGISDAIVGFHAQQSVEKALKAVLASHEIEFPFTHDLDGLMELCKTNGIDMPSELDGVDRLTPYGVQWRYGGASSQPHPAGGEGYEQYWDECVSRPQWANFAMTPDFRSGRYRGLLPVM